MAILQGCLLVLKWIGILLLILLGLVLVLLLLALLAPVRYKGKVKKQELPENALAADGLVSWLNPLVRVRILYSEKKLRYTVRLFGFCLMDSDKPKKERKEKPKKTKKAKKSKKSKEAKKTGKKQEQPKPKVPKESVETQTEAPVSHGKTDAGSEQLASVQAQGNEEVSQETAEEPKKKAFVEKLKAFFEKLGAIPKKIKEKVLRIRKQIELLWTKKEATVAFLQNEQHMQAVGKALKAVKELLKHCMPRKLKGYVEFGAGNPETTGKALAALGILYAAHGKHLTIVPDFYEKKVVADVFFRGRIRLGTVLVMVLRFIRDKQVKAFYKDWKKFVGVLKQKAE